MHNKITIELTSGDAILLYSILYDFVRANHQNLEDSDLAFIGGVKQQLSDAVFEMDKEACHA